MGSSARHQEARVTGSGYSIVYSSRHCIVVQVAETPTSTAPGASDSARQPTEGQAGSPLSRIAGKSMVELQDALQLHEAVQQRAPDPASLEVIQADRLLAAANNKAVSVLCSKQML